MTELRGVTFDGEKLAITEYLSIDLDKETWHCRRCDQNLGNARGPYKEALVVYEREPSDIHDPVIDPEKYAFTYSPDPEWCRIIEYYCPRCATQIEVEYLPPGHPLTVDDLVLDIDSLKARHAGDPS
ncbi:MAG: acetone carboxylase subunit gamma [Gammaproteobacteria bacterium]|nr:MAG: acetone carboxylase subunit gamma [Gammaproteobacteria bacterium]RLA59687.1 MAG: acetone carboxylase subunit gamma [Gammaproteobacteria bacterium]